MKLKRFAIENFRGYKDCTSVDLEDFTAFVGKNDAGKSTILEALDIFFHDGKGAKGNGTVTIDKDDINKNSGSKDIVLIATFSDLPNEILLDDTVATNLTKEYLTNANGDLVIKKVFPNASSTCKVSIIANHPNNENCKLLLQTKQKDLQKKITELGLTCEDERKNPLMRKAIWEYYKDCLDLQETEIDVSSKDGDMKAIWEKIKVYLPFYSLFQSDRKNSDSDNEVQDPLKEAVKIIMSDAAIQTTLSGVFDSVKHKLEEVSTSTLEKLREMNPDIATGLNPKIPKCEELKWADVFKSVSITGDNDIPINKRGSGVRRLILLNFFRAEAERRQRNENNPSIIYAIEEPETSQHKGHQKMLIKALKKLSSQNNTQIIITTHSGDIVRALDFTSIRLITHNLHTNSAEITLVEKQTLPYVSLNEVNFIAFEDFSIEYHDELYAFLQEKHLFNQYKQGKTMLPYTRLNDNGTTTPEQKILTEIIRHVNHHPENTYNTYTEEQLKQSIKDMRSFIAGQNIV